MPASRLAQGAQRSARDRIPVTGSGERAGPSPVTPKNAAPPETATAPKQQGGSKTALLILGGAAVVGGGVALAAGHGSSTPQVASTPVPPQKAVIKVLMDPNPAIATPTGDPAFPWDFRFNLQVSDSGGVGFIVTSMQTITSALTGALLSTTEQNPFVGVKIPAFGKETRQYHNSPYRMESFTRQGKANVEMNFGDDRGNASAFDRTISFLHAGGPVRLEP